MLMITDEEFELFYTEQCVVHDHKLKINTVYNECNI